MMFLPDPVDPIRSCRFIELVTGFFLYTFLQFLLFEIDRINRINRINRLGLTKEQVE
jgi:hypothetical protein